VKVSPIRSFKYRSQRVHNSFRICHYFFPSEGLIFGL
jgi:hypothetical protein